MTQRARIGRLRYPVFLCGVLHVTLGLSPLPLRAQNQPSGPGITPGPQRSGRNEAGADVLHQLSDSFQALVAKVAPSVVQVRVTAYTAVDQGKNNDTDLVVGRERRIGSGVIIDPNGYIITNAHVIRGAERVQVLIPASAARSTSVSVIPENAGQAVPARVVGLSTILDLALLQVDAHDLRAIPVARFAPARLGEMVFAFGSPEGLENTVTMGVVSAVARQPDPDSPLVYVQTDTPINPGNSGGPLVNVDGQLVGINTFILSQSGGNEGLGFAIPSLILSFAYPQLRKYGHVHRGEIGAAVQSITPPLAAGLHLPRDTGVIFSDIAPGGPADKAGLKIGDIILAVDGKLIGNLPLFGYTFFTHSPGDHVKIVVLRGNQKLDFDLPMVEQEHKVDRLADSVDPEKSLVPQLGILGVEIDDQIARMLPDLRLSTGIVVAARAATEAADSPLVTGDVIHALNGAPVISIKGLRSLLEALKPSDPIILQIEREGRMMYVNAGAAWP